MPLINEGHEVFYYHNFICEMYRYPVKKSYFEDKDNLQQPIFITSPIDMHFEGF